MPVFICERCGKETHRTEKCNYCGKKICKACVKSSKNVKKTQRLVICKDCWGKMEARKKWKSA